jgi:hypothetical protein
MLPWRFTTHGIQVDILMIRRWLRATGLIIVGLAVGGGLGLYLGWVAWPTEFTDANPSVLQESYQHDYILMTAAAYSVDGDLAAARQRINRLGESGQDTLFSYTLDTIIEADNELAIRQLARLSADLGLQSPALDPFLLTPASEPGNGE